MTGTVTALAGGQRALGAVVDAFPAQPRSAITARTYTRTLERLADELGRDRPLAGVTADELAAAASLLWGCLAPRCRRRGWRAGSLELRADRRAAADDDTWAIPLPSWNGCGPEPTSRCGSGRCGGLLYDSAARADEVLGLDVPDLGLANRQARARTKGGHVRPLTSDRRRPAAGQAHRKPPVRPGVPHRAPGRRAPGHGCRRPGPGAAAGPGCRMRWPSSCSSGTPAARPCTSYGTRLTHLGEANVSAPLLMAISGHKRLATLSSTSSPARPLSPH